MRKLATALSLAVLTFASAVPVAGASGSASAAHRWKLDPAFGSGGIVSTDFPGSGHRYAWGYDSAVQADGRTVVVGVASGQYDDVAVARYLEDGSLDPSFGDGGRVTIGPHALFRPASIAFQDVAGQHKILIAAATTFRDPYRYRCSVMRLNSDGTLDSHDDADPGVAFGYDGTKVVQFPDNSGFCQGMVVAPDRKIVVTVRADSNDGDVGVFRLLGRNGALDGGFGDGGRVTLAAGGFQLPGPVAIQPASTGTARILVGGMVSRAHGYDWALWRLRWDGELDRTFGRSGRTVTTMYDDRVQQSFESISGLALEDDGGIVAAGDYRAWPAGADYPEDTAGVARYTPDGRLDRRFGERGTVHLPYDGRGNTSAQDVTLDGKGRIVFGGALQMPTSGLLLAGGFTASGTPDTRFGASGFVELLVGGGPYTGAASVSLDPAGRAVLAGIYGDPTGDSDRFGLVRLRLARGQTASGV